MILELADNSRGGRGPRLVRTTRAKKSRYIYNPKTGVAKLVPPPQELSKPFKKLKAKVAAKKAAKTVKREAKKAVKTAKREARQQGKIQRAVNRATAKTQRQATRQLRKQTRLDVRAEKQENRRQRVLGRREVTAARQEQKIKNIQSKSQAVPEEEYDEYEATQEEVYDPNADELPEEFIDDVTGGDYLITPETNMESAEYADYDEYEEYEEEEPAEEYEEAEELSAGGELNLANILKVITTGQQVLTTIKKPTNADKLDKIQEDVRVIRQHVEGGELSAGWIDAVVKVAKGAAGGIVQSVAPDSKVAKSLLKIKDSKVGKAVQKVAGSKVGKAVTGAVTSQAQVNALKQQNAKLKLEAAKLRKQRIIFGVSGAAAGAVTGYALSKLSK